MGGMKSVAFNGGEISPELSLWSDLDVPAGGAGVGEFPMCRRWVGCAAGGMTAFCPAMERSRLVPYVYSQEERFLVEVWGAHRWRQVLHCESGGARLYQYGYDFQSDAYVSRDLMVFA